MAQTIPLIRAAALAPILIWMGERGLSRNARLAAAGLPGALLHDPERPVPLRAAVDFLCRAAATEGPDIALRVVTDTSFAHLAILGRAALGARTPREALTRIQRAYPHHSSHEHFVLQPTAGGLTVRHWFGMAMDDAALHLCHQYVAALLRVLTAGCGHDGPRLTALRLTPHPQAGLAHLGARLDVVPRPATDRTLELTFPAALVDRPYLHRTRDRAPTRLEPIRGDGTLSFSLRAILPDILDARPVRISEIARLAGTSPRTLQRRLAGEGTSLSDLVDALRRDRAEAQLRRGHDPMGAIAADLGYSHQSSLSRAVRRWSDAPPSRLRGLRS